jgi:hypothetical protein
MLPKGNSQRMIAAKNTKNNEFQNVFFAKTGLKKIKRIKTQIIMLIENSNTIKYER